MANIELPKDADGREIPLDTVALYDDDGNVYSIRRFIYTNDFDLNDKWMNSWMLINDNYGAVKPEQMHLTKPDSWKKLEEDLGKVANNKAKTIVCSYFDREAKDCEGCKFENCDRTCSYAFLKDIMERIHKMRGED